MRISGAVDEGKLTGEWETHHRSERIGRVWQQYGYAVVLLGVGLGKFPSNTCCNRQVLSHVECVCEIGPDVPLDGIRKGDAGKTAAGWISNKERSSGVAGIRNLAAGGGINLRRKSLVKGEASSGGGALSEV